MTTDAPKDPTPAPDRVAVVVGGETVVVGEDEVILTEDGESLTEAERAQ